MAFIVIYDACVLYPAPLWDLFVRLGMVGIVRARWTEEILDECFRSILGQRPDLKAEQLVRTRQLMREAIADCTVTGYAHLIDGLKLPDPDDRHVLAAAIRAGAQAIVTFNLKDFPESALVPYEIEALHPDDFVLDLIDLAPAAVVKVVQDQAAALKSPPKPPRNCSIRSATTASYKPSPSSDRCTETRSVQTSEALQSSANRRHSRQRAPTTLIAPS